MAAIAVQTNFRMLRIKWNFEKIVAACKMMQRCWRGFKGREEFGNRTERDRKERQLKFFSEQAKII